MYTNVDVSTRLTESGYMRAKLAQQDLVKTGKVPDSIVRSTQFFEFIPGIADASADGDTVRATSATLQPIASYDVVSRLAEVVTGAPVNGTVEIAGPEPLGIDELARRYFEATEDTRQVVTDDRAGYFGAVLDDAALTPTPAAAAWIAPTTLDKWLMARS
jgi:uncharacterized protein YbjT (DUF2867 family)